MKYIIQNINNENSKGIGINIPFDGSTGINSTFNTKDATRANLLNFLLTGKGERILNTTFGSGVRDQIFENISQQNLENIYNIIYNNILNSFSNVLLEELNVIPNEDDNMINIYLKYSIKNTNITDDIQININR